MNTIMLLLFLETDAQWHHLLSIFRIKVRSAAQITKTKESFSERLEFLNFSLSQNMYYGKRIL